MSDIYMRPYITEKTLTLANQGWYTFRFRGKAAKRQLATLIEGIYKVSVENIRTISTHPKMRRVGKKMKPIAQPEWKKAMVKLQKGQKIDAFEVSGSDQK